MDPTTYPANPAGSAKPKNYLVENIVAAVVGLLCCCGISTIPGVVGIVFATQVDSKFNQGDYTGAASAANTAKTMFYVTAGLVVLGFVINIIYFFVFGVSLFTGLRERGINNF